MPVVVVVETTILRLGTRGSSARMSCVQTSTSADADSVQPDDVAVGQRLFQGHVIFAKPLAKARQPVAAPPHPPEIVRRGQHEKNDEQYVV